MALGTSGPSASLIAFDVGIRCYLFSGGLRASVPYRSSAPSADLLNRPDVQCAWYDQGSIQFRPDTGSRWNSFNSSPPCAGLHPRCVRCGPSIFSAPLTHVVCDRILLEQYSIINIPRDLRLPSEVHALRMATAGGPKSENRRGKSVVIDVIREGSTPATSCSCS